jgi:cytosine/adenosine deaminase-related metal-dependent hydrolase
MKSVRLIHAALVADGANVQAAPGALLLDGRRVVGVGSPEEVGRPAGVEVESLHAHAVMPAFVNAHTHLDLTACGYRPYDGDFDAWLLDILAFRSQQTPESVDASVAQGVRALDAGGVAAVGDIAGHQAPHPSLKHLAAAGIGGVSFTEIFGMGPRIPGAFDVPGAPTSPGPPGAYLRPGWQPHAPYSSDRRVFAASLETGYPVSTHLSESPEEIEFIRSGTGRFRRFLEKLGVWDGSAHVGVRHPVDWLAQILQGAPGARALCAHCNYVDDPALDILAAGQFDVAFCPRSSAYFGHVGHRYREMLQRGITVALGTDSMVCLTTPDRLSTFDEFRFLMRRDGLDLSTALAMATIHGARALGLSEDAFRFATGVAQESAGITQVPLDRPGSTVAAAAHALAHTQAAPAWLLRPQAPDSHPNQNQPQILRNYCL